MTFEEFTKKVLKKFDISFHVMRMHYNLKFNPRVIQDLENEDDLDNVVSHSDDFANVCIVELSRVKAIEANISNTQLAFGGPSPTFPSSNVSCDAIPNTIMLSRGFASCSADSEYTHLESNQFCEAILVHTYQVNHNHMAQYECSSKVRVSSKRDDVNIFSVKYARILNAKEINPRTIMEYTSHEVCEDETLQDGGSKIFLVSNPASETSSKKTRQRRIESQFSHKELFIALDAMT
ncbi:hypothetical protein AAG906_014633 [Vitis piasezkii]